MQGHQMSRKIPVNGLSSLSVVHAAAIKAGICRLDIPETASTRLGQLFSSDCRPALRKKMAVQVGEAKDKGHTGPSCYMYYYPRSPTNTWLCV
ncbi:hypothetical protein Cob_v000327 [Colletotrichum orbiculare MAFF 240422]|uniref:Uncharacterized protein n=1 Tax=Colletotrichum orbiculare (strain 104-T / ATCC 96160 / CBS 514.97 / LARS 414 / MAFF 240422) TaxID=1213857 RepID=A0A484G7L9_COLOR|nr:hypothetical protein Cob_v000327 [Colletotrichum orbiculare MAFF 240422]